MHPQHAQVGTIPRFEARGTEATVPVNREPTTKAEWKRLAHALKSARPEDYPQIDPAQFAEFRTGVLRYAGGRDLWVWMLVALLLVLAIWILGPAALPSESRFLIGIVMTIIALALPAVGVVARNNLRTNVLGLGWAIDFFKLP